MSTGGIGLVLGQTPHRFRGLNTIGDIIVILDLVLVLGEESSGRFTGSEYPLDINFGCKPCQPYCRAQYNSR